jgi:hydrogenase expression/formation protein HypC
MCMSRPGLVVRVKGGMAEVDRGGVRAWFNVLPVPEAKAGDWVLVHASLVLAVISPEEAQQVAALLPVQEVGEG